MNQKGDAGDAVRQLHQKLASMGYSPGTEELAAQRFGDATVAAVRAFQRHHAGPDRQPLPQDGNVGPETSWALEHPPGSNDGLIAPGWRFDPATARPELIPLLTVALREIGNREQPDGTRTGPMIDKYAHGGRPWSTFFLSWCFDQVGACPWGRVAAPSGLLEWARQSGRELALGAQLQPGDVFCIIRFTAAGEDEGVAGLVVGTSYDGQLTFTIEGVSTVRGVVRSRLEPTAYLRPIPAIA